MKKIGREVLFLSTNDQNPRNGEGAFLRLKDGRILYAFTEYEESDGADHAPAHIAGIYSDDEGETWYGRRVLVEREEDDNNLMCVSLMRMQNGDLGLLTGRKYLRKETDPREGLKAEGAIAMEAFLIRSSDEGETWSERVCCTPAPENYFCLENDRLKRLRSGRLILPCNLHESKQGVACFFYSDDDGVTWKNTGNAIPIPGGESSSGLAETGVFERDDGVIVAFSRTRFGSQYLCYSQDGGMTFTTPAPSESFLSAEAPMNMGTAGDKVVAVFNPMAAYVGRDLRGNWGRSPLVLSVSDDGGKTFAKADLTGRRYENQIAHVFAIEDDPACGYCYSSLFEGKDYLLVAYYHSENNLNTVLKAAKITKISFSEFGAQPK